MNKVSILLPTYNCERYLSDAIESILAQTYQNWEVLISDNYSQDGTYEIAKKYASRDQRILCWRNESNIGSAKNYNKCVEKASGQYIELFGADDIFEPNCLEKSVEILDKNENVVLVTTARRHIDASGQVIREDHPQNGSQLMSAQTVIRNIMSTLTNWIVSPVMFRAKYKGTGFDISLGNYADLEYWAQILQHGNLYYIDEMLFNYRVHGGSETTRTLGDLEFAIYLLRIAERYKHYMLSEDHPDTLPYKIVIDKLIKLVDYATNYLKLDFTSLLGTLGDNTNEKTTNVPLRVSDPLDNDLYDFKRVSYLSLLRAIDLRKELDWIYSEYNNLQKQHQSSTNNKNYSDKQIETVGSSLNRDSWQLYTKELNDLRSENGALQQRIDQLSSELNFLLNSKSWKITAPLRMVRKKVSSSGSQ